MKVRVGFGLGTTASGGAGGEVWAAIVDACEALGWDSLWFSERVTADVPDPLAMMAFVAGRTRRLKFGPSVLVLPGRNPVLLAKELATIDQLSGGRLVVAVGLGAPVPSEHEVFGVDRKEAAGRTEETVALMKRLWTEDAIMHSGPFFTVGGVSIRPRPAQEPHPDVWFGGHSSAALLRTGRFGDGWLPSFVSPDEYKQKADVVRGSAASANREIDEEHFGALVPYVPPQPTVDPEPVIAMFSARRSNVDPDEVLVRDGDDALRHRLEAFIQQGASKFVVLPLVPPTDWNEELSRLRDRVAAPLEN